MYCLVSDFTHRFVFRKRISGLVNERKGIQDRNYPLAGNKTLDQISSIFQSANTPFFLAA